MKKWQDDLFLLLIDDRVYLAVVLMLKITYTKRKKIIIINDIH